MLFHADWKRLPRSSINISSVCCFLVLKHNVSSKKPGELWFCRPWSILMFQMWFTMAEALDGFHRWGKLLAYDANAEEHDGNQRPGGMHTQNAQHVLNLQSCCSWSCLKPWLDMNSAHFTVTVMTLYTVNRMDPSQKLEYILDLLSSVCLCTVSICFIRPRREYPWVETVCWTLVAAELHNPALHQAISETCARVAPKNSRYTLIKSYWYRQL